MVVEASELAGDCPLLDSVTNPKQVVYVTEVTLCDSWLAPSPTQTAVNQIDLS